MLANQVVANFRAYMRARTDPIGAHDSALPHPKSPPLRIADFEPGGAYDSAEETAMLDPADVAGIAAWVRKNLSLDQQGELVAHLTSNNEMPATAADDSRRRALARDARTPRRPTSADHAAFNARFPEAARIKHV